MDYKFFVKKHFLKRLESNTKCNSEMKASLKDHPKMHEFINNLSLELPRVQNYRIAKGKPPFQLKDLAWLVDEYTDLFITGIENQADRARESSMQKYEREHSNDHVKEMEAALEGDSQGAYKDLGLIVGDTEEREV